MEEVLGGRMHRVGHVQIAQAPERNEPDRAAASGQK